MGHYLISERGSAAVEYAILLGLFAATVGLAAIGLGASVSGSLTTSAGLFASADAGDAPGAPPGKGNGKGLGHGNGGVGNGKGLGNAKH